MQNKPQFICRCSSIGKIMTNPQTKSPLAKYNDAVESFRSNQEKYANTVNKTTKTADKLLERVISLEKEIKVLETNKDTIHLSKTAISAVEDWMKETLGYPRQGLSNKYTQKGLLMESEAIEFAAKYYGWGKVEKNTERRANEYISGECDVVLPDRIDDIKCSWSDDTFPLMYTDIPIDGYGHQGMGYTALWSKPLFQLTYCLMDAPDMIVDREANKVRFDLGLDEVDVELWEEVKSKHTYSNLHDDLRIKSFFVEHDKSIIESVYERVEYCRKWVEQSGFYELWERTRKN